MVAIEMVAIEMVPMEMGVTGTPGQATPMTDML